MKPDRLVAEYVHAYGVHAVVVASLGDRQFVGYGADPEVAAKQIASGLGRSHVRLEQTWWTASVVDARRLADAIAERGGGDVPSIARAIGVAVTSDDVLKRRAADAVAFAEQQLAEMQKNGGLKAINRAYKTMRQQNEARGEKTPPYTAYLAGEKLRIIRTVAAGVRANAR